MYNETWDPSYGVNYGQYRGSDRYTVSESYSYSKTYVTPRSSMAGISLLLYLCSCDDHDQMKLIFFIMCNEKIICNGQTQVMTTKPANLLVLYLGAKTQINRRYRLSPAPCR